MVQILHIYKSSPNKPKHQIVYEFSGSVFDLNIDNLNCDLFGSKEALMLGLHRIVTNLGPINELKNSGFLGLLSSH